MRCLPYGQTDLLPTLLLLDNGTPKEEGSHDNTDDDLIVYQGTRIQSSSGVTYTILGKLGSGAFGQVYEACRQDISQDESHFAMKISKSTQTSIGQFQYEQQALAFVCIFFAIIWKLRFSCYCFFYKNFVFC